MEVKDVLAMMKTEPIIMELVGIIESLDLAEACLCAGTIRNTVWNKLAGYPTQLISDVDVIFFDPHVSYEETEIIQAQLCLNYPQFQWEVKNQVFMHIHHPEQRPYQSVTEAIAHFPERCTALGLYQKHQQLKLIAPYGVSDLAAFRVRPTPSFSATATSLNVYQERLATKKWLQRWPQLTMEQI